MGILLIPGRGRENTPLLSCSFSQDFSEMKLNVISRAYIHGFTPLRASFLVRH